LSPPTKPSLDSDLARYCPPIGEKPAGDYDDWQQWITDTLIPLYVDCAIRHNRTVDAWPK
jgi:hypothetical protein